MTPKPRLLVKQGPCASNQNKAAQPDAFDPIAQSWGSLAIDQDHLRELMAEDDLLESSFQLEASSALCPPPESPVLVPRQLVKLEVAFGAAFAQLDGH